MTVRDVFYALALVTLLGWLLHIGKIVILPMIVALLLAYVLVGATKALGKLPLLSMLPPWAHYVLVMLLFAMGLLAIGLITAANVSSLTEKGPEFRENLAAITSPITFYYGDERQLTFDAVEALALERIDFAAMSLRVLSTTVSVGGFTVLIIAYVTFLLAERLLFLRKLSRLLPDREERGTAGEIFTQINERIVSYLSAKTLINFVLGAISYVVLWAMDVDHAVFWALVIGILNYIPYLGSLLAVAIVSIYAAVQFGDAQPTLIVGALLTAGQIYVGNWLEPRVVGRSMNLSPFVVLAALVVWSSLWGVPGAIIAVPMTSILMIVLAAFDRTRAIPILLSRNGEV